VVPTEKHGGTPEEKDTLQIKGVPVFTLNFQDLMQSKQAAGRPQDLEDIKHLESIQTLKNKEGIKT